jgi:Mg2+-importing ATPase
VIGLTVALPYTPLAPPLGFVPLPPPFFIAPALVVLLYVAAAEVAKGFFYGRERRDSSSASRAAGSRCDAPAEIRLGGLSLPSADRSRDR